MEINEQEFQKYLKLAIRDIKKIIRIKSVHQPAQPEAPYGLETKKVLDFTLALAQEMGFHAVRGHNNEYGYADFGTGPQLFGIICHLDVVPPGDLTKWVKSPWVPVIENNELYGRGVLDDKGPAIINLYALKYLKDHGFNPQDYTIRIIFGLTEETTWESITSYFAHERKPDIAYTPDGEWPVIYAEKGIINFDLVGPGVDSLTMHGGEAYNVVCDVNEITTHHVQELKVAFDHFDYDYTQTGNKLVAKGRAAHGSTPELGINAAINTFVAMHKTKLWPNLAIANFVFDNFKNENYSLPNIWKKYNDESGDVTCNLGMVRINQREQRLSFNARIPITYTQQQVVEDLTKALKEYPTLHLEVKKWSDPKHVDQKSPLIQKMLGVYRAVTGDTKAQALAIGGGTYARAMDNCVAFGACKSIDLMHNVNERISLDELATMFEIYIKAIYELTK